MRKFFYDYETYWAVDHSLTKMNPILYVMHPKTEIQVITYAFDDDPVQIVFGEKQISELLHDVIRDDMMIAHNGSGFDHMITEWRLGVRPKAWSCTLAIARPFFGLTCGVSLKAVAKALGLEDKGQMPMSTKGKRLMDFTSDEKQMMRTYALQDTELCRGIFNKLALRLGKFELQLLDAIIKMTLECAFDLDMPLLQAGYAAELIRKDKALLQLATVCGFDAATMDATTAQEAMRTIVMSQPRFASLLTGLGAVVPMKESPTVLNPDGYPKMIPALGKNDKGLLALVDDPNELIATAAACRVEVKSSQLETRLRSLLNVGGVLGNAVGYPLNYCGAEITWRMSGAMALNMQNLPRIDLKESKPSDALRQCLLAPEGYLYCGVDSSNIELRVAHMLAGQMDVIQMLRNKEDLYCWFASLVLGRTVTKDMKLDRYLGKQGMLQLQFGAGWSSFRDTVRINSKGVMVLEETEARRVVNVWRERFDKVANYKSGAWARCEEGINAMFTGDSIELDDQGLCRTGRERVLTPQGHWLTYPDLRQTIAADGRNRWMYGQGRHTTALWGSKNFANIVQHLARLIVMEQTMKLNKLYTVCLSAHDEAGCMVLQEEAPACKAAMLEIFSTSPAWWPDIPLACEAGYGKRYSDAK